MTDLSRRGFLKGATLAGAAVALGRLPSLPVPAPTITTPLAAMPAVALPTVAKMAMWAPVSTEMIEDGMALRSVIDDHLRAALAAEEERQLAPWFTEAVV